jgi:CRISPR-associated protein Cas6
MSIPTHVDVAFPATGTTVPLDHGYALYAALCHQLPGLHEHSGWAVHPIRGQRAEPGILALVLRGAGRSAVKLRLPVESLPQALSLVGRTLDLHGHRIMLGAPVVYPLLPSAELRARWVTIHGFHEEPEPFAEALKRQLEAVPALEQAANAIVCTVGPRRVQRIKGKQVVGFAVRLEGLAERASIAVQVVGLGGRRRMGAGVFVPPPRA